MKGFMMDERVKTKSESKAREETIGQRLDRELEDSFPASDAPSLTQPLQATDENVVSRKQVKAKGDDEG